METKQIEIRIYKDGTIKSQTKNIKGKSCMKYLKLLENISEAQVVDSEFTKEYYEVEQNIENSQTNTMYNEGGI